MNKEYSRAERVSEHIHKELARIIQTEMKDPRVGIVSMSDVIINRDFSFADVYVSFLGMEGQKAIDSALKVMQGASGFLRSRLAFGVRLRFVPKLRFYHDGSTKQGVYVSSLIDGVIGEDLQKKHLLENETE